MTKLAITCAFVPLLACAANAAVYSSQSAYLAASTSVEVVADFEGLAGDYSITFPSSPYEVADNLTISSNSGLMVLGYYLLGGGTAGLATGGYSDTLTLSFAEGTDSVGFDYFLASSWSEGPLGIVVYGADNAVLYNSGGLSAPVRVTPNTGDPESPPSAFFGIDGVGTIFRVDIGGTGVASPGVDNVYLPVPEPSSVAYAGLLAAGALLRRRRCSK